jgi:enoyl-CoA hydratase/carnithine racemase
MNKKKKVAGRKGGAQPNNKNALKHGFYSKQFTANEAKRIEGADRYALDDELDLIRLYTDRLANEISFDEITLKDQNGNQSRDTHYLQQLNTLSIMMQARSTMIRTHYLTRGKGGTVETTIQQAMEELALELGI